jgi:flagellin-like protein
MKSVVGCRSDRGVSPVIGVVLLVAIVVILAATISVSVLQFGGQTQEQAPSVGITAEYSLMTTPNGEYFNLTVKSGETVETRNLYFVLRGAVDTETGNEVSIDDTTPPAEAQSGSTLTAGDKISIGANQVTPTPTGSLDLSDAELRLVWHSQDKDTEESAIIWRWKPTN